MARGEYASMAVKTEEEVRVGAPGPATTIVDRMYENGVALPDETKRRVTEILQRRLAEAIDLQSQAKFAHWNVKGFNFYQLHLVFDSVQETILNQIDPIAERITQLGGVANGTVRQAVCLSRVPEYPVDAVAGMEHVEALSNALGDYCADLREAARDIRECGDPPTAHFLKRLIQKAEEQLYFLESHLEAGDVQ